MDESKSVGFTISYVPESATSSAVSQERSEEESHCQQASIELEECLVEHRNRNCLEEQRMGQESDHTSEEQLSGYEWDEQRHSVSDQNYFGDLSSFSSGSIPNLDFFVHSEPSWHKLDKRFSMVMISTHGKTTETVSSSQLFQSTVLDEVGEPISKEVHIKIHILRLSVTDLRVAAVILTMLCVIGILNPLALCCTIPAYYCATKAKKCKNGYEASCRARTACIFLIVTLLTPIFFYGAIIALNLMY